jgi:anti-sigma factor RsiW
MNDHLSSIELNRLADGELSAEQLAAAQQHLEACPACTSQALAESLLKRAVSRTGHRYVAPADFAERLRRRAFANVPHSPAPASPSARDFAFAGWATAAVFLLACVLLLFRGVRDAGSPLVAEVSDVHIATLAANQPPQVVSSDRHTVKPWFQGKLPFSFNLPSTLPADVVLEGANLTYLENQPVAQLIYSIGRHRASVFLRQHHGTEMPVQAGTEYSGFHVTSFRTNGLDGVVVSDVDPSRLAELARMVEQAQTPPHP